jgi:hypothetical protein
MKEKIIEILEELEDQFETTGYYSSFAGYGIKRADYDKLAERIVKLFAIPAVINLVCDHPSNERIKLEGGNEQCGKCWQYIE